ncbi:MAG TPA: DUF2703 domain-containing protein [Bellilinea sp.]|nr:DUF2703 domain-containing protein [Bellilinea sp.]
MRQINVDYLYLDLNTCRRCIATDDTLKLALKALAPVFEELDYQVSVNTIHISSQQLAKQYQFISSPTIRVNGVDICGELAENNCEDCGDLCGENTDCRLFVYEGKKYEQPPVAMIVDGILKALYAQPQPVLEIYSVPENLERFFKEKSTS